MAGRSPTSTHHSLRSGNAPTRDLPSVDPSETPGPVRGLHSLFANPQRGSDGLGDLLGWALLIVLVVIVMGITSHSDWLGGNVRETYRQCVAAAHSEAEVAACDPTRVQPSTPPAAR